MIADLKFDSTFVALVLTLCLIPLGYALKAVKDLDVKGELLKAAVIWENIQLPIAKIFLEEQEMFFHLSNYFVGRSIIYTLKTVFIIGNLIFIMLCIGFVYFAKWWVTAELSISDFRTYFVLFVCWFIFALAIWLTIHVLIRQSISIVRSTIPKDKRYSV